MYANQLYYTTRYLQGRLPLIPADEFNFWAKKAQKRMNWRGIEVLEIPDCLADCCCEVAEALYLETQQEAMAMQPAQRVGSFSMGAVHPPNTGDVQAQVQTIMASWLAGTVLYNWFVYRGL